MQESRLFKIVYYLLEKGHATASELSRKFEVSVRTIYRDIDALSGAGVPVYAEAGRNGGICLMSGFVLDRALLSESEKEEILAALQSLNITHNSNGSDTLSKLAAVFNIGGQDWMEVDFSRWGNKPSDNKKFEDLKSAVIRRKAMKLTYAGSNGTTTERKIYPLKLSYKARSWYVKAYCVGKEDYRLFKLTRILEWEVLDEIFDCPAFPEQSDAAPQGCTRITLCFPKEMAYRVYDEFAPAEVARQENGDLLVCAEMPEDMWLVGFLLTFGTQVEVIEPLYLKEILAEQARQIYEKNVTHQS